MEERERNIMCKSYMDWLPPTLPIGDLACNPGVCSDRELNHNLLVHRPALSPLNNTSQGRAVEFKHYWADIFISGL